MVGAFAMFQQLSAENKGDFDTIKDTLLNAFAMDWFAAYMQFVEHHLHLEETVDVFLADVKRNGENRVLMWLQSLVECKYVEFCLSVFNWKRERRLGWRSW